MRVKHWSKSRQTLVKWLGPSPLCSSPRPACGPRPSCEASFGTSASKLINMFINYVCEASPSTPILGEYASPRCSSPRPACASSGNDCCNDVRQDPPRPLQRQPPPPPRPSRVLTDGVCSDSIPPPAHSGPLESSLTGTSLTGPPRPCWSPLPRLSTHLQQHLQSLPSLAL